MKFLLTVFVFLLTVISSLSEDITVTGTEGEPVIIKCPYPGGYENSNKYFYKGVYRESVIILRSDGGKSSPRFLLQDDHQTRSFTVTISNLKMEDAGTYGCIAGWGEYKVIKLIVIRAPQRPKPVQISTSTIRSNTNTSTEHSSTEHTSTEHSSSEHSSSEHTSTEHTSTVSHQTESDTRTTAGNTTVELSQSNTTMRSDLASVAGGLGSVLLFLTLCSGTFLILKKRKRKCGTALFQQNVQHNTETDRMYEEIPNSDVALVTSSSNQTPASHLDNHPEVSAVYTTVTKQQPDSNPGHTHSTNQVTDPDCDYYANIKSPDPTQDSRTELIYVTATHPQNNTTHPQNMTTNEGLTYSVIKKKTVHRHCE